MTRKYDHITPAMLRLHWLPVHQRIEYKILLLVYKALHGQAPVYLNELLKQRADRGSRLDGQMLLVIPAITRKSFGGRSFMYAGPSLWNKLPNNVCMCKSLEQIKKLLKSYLFTGAYGL